MPEGYLAGDLDRYQPGPDDDYEEYIVDHDAAEWIVCPECGSTAAGYIFWAEGVDMDFHCPDCGARYGVR